MPRPSSLRLPPGVRRRLAAIRRRLAAARRALDAPHPRGLWIAPALAWRTAREIRSDRVIGMAAEAAFWALLSLPPLALALLGVVGYVGDVFGPDALADVRAGVFEAVSYVLTPTTMRGIVRPLVHQMLSPGHGEVVSFGFVVALWSGSAAMSRYISTITVAYDMEGLRQLWRTRLLAFLLNLSAIGVGIVLLPALVMGPDVLVGLVPDSATPATLRAVYSSYWPLMVVLSVCALTTLYHVGVPVRTPWHRDVPGAVLAMALWACGSFVLRTYLTSNLRETEYGPLAAPIAALLFLYVAAFAVLVGAELNSEIDALWPVESTAEGRARALAGASGNRQPVEPVRTEEAGNTGGGQGSDTRRRSE